MSIYSCGQSKYSASNFASSRVTNCVYVRLSGNRENLVFSVHRISVKAVEKTSVDMSREEFFRYLDENDIHTISFSRSNFRYHFRVARKGGFGVEKEIGTRVYVSFRTAKFQKMMGRVRWT
jgi:hypothetical protein